MDAHSRSLVPSRSGQTVTAAPADTALHVQDLYYVIFRHKWKIIICSLLGFAGAGTFQYVQKPSFESEAKLFVRYVVSEGRALTPSAASSDEVRKSPDRGGETIMASEMEILSSTDLARQVVESVGAEKILAKSGGGKNASAAAGLVKIGLSVDIPPKSSVIRILFKHPDPEVVQPVLRAVIDNYLKRHLEIHRAGGMLGDFLTQETDQLRSRLVQTEDELRKARNKAGVVSMEETKKSYAAQITRLRESIFNAEAEYAERAALLAERAKRFTPPSTETAAPLEPAKPVTPSIAEIEDYKNLGNRLNLLQTKEQQLLVQFTEGNDRVKEVRAQIAEVEPLKRELEEKYPVFIEGRPTANGVPAKAVASDIDPLSEVARLPALAAKIKALTAQLDQVKAEVTGIDQMELTILELTRRKELEEANYRFYAASLEQSRISEALGAGKVSNISQIQLPSPPKVDSGKTAKKVAGIAAGGIIVGLAWALLIEFYLDRSVRTPNDVEKTLGLRLFLSIPNQTWKKRRSKRNRKAAPSEQAFDGAAGALALGENTTPDESEQLRPFHETLRDRLVGYFDRKDLTHTPKLVAVTGIGDNTGVTTIAAGLARSLSETGDGNVLLVDMTAGQGSSQQFSRGKAVCGLDAVLSTREEAQVESNLYVVTDRAGGDRISGILPHRFSKLLPQLKASNFDYIIFDMPPVNQISVTLRLVGFMDMALLVIESEKTDREAIRRATTFLAESKADVGAILNKTRTYVPKWLHQDQLAAV
jgi:polysaccharide biosynthesis transport protein